jgi:hypothetical protein
LAAKLDEMQTLNRKIESALRLKHEEFYKESREKEQILIEFKAQ